VDYLSIELNPAQDICVVLKYLTHAAQADGGTMIRRSSLVLALLSVSVFAIGFGEEGQPNDNFNHSK